MNDSEIEQLKRELSEYKAKNDDANSKVAALLTQGKALGMKTVTHVIGEFEFDTMSFIPKSVSSKFIESMKEVESETVEDFDMDILNDIYAEFVSSLCVDEELKDKSVWLKFNDVSGLLVPLGNSLFKSLTVTDRELESFRKK